MSSDLTLSAAAIEHAADGDSMLHEYGTSDHPQPAAWTKLTRLDTRVGLDVRPYLDPIPAEKFDLWEAVAFQAFRRRTIGGAA